MRQMRHVRPIAAALGLASAVIVGAARVSAQEVSPSKTNLVAIGGAAVQGVAVLETQGDRTRVTVSLVSDQPGGTAAAVHRGDCAGPGEVIAELGRTAPAPEGGQRVTASVDRRLGTLQDGGHLVLLRSPSGPAVACGQIARAGERSPSPLPRTGTGVAPVRAALLVGAVALVVGLGLRRRWSGSWLP